MAIAAGIDDEIAIPRLCAGPAQRTIQRDMSGFLQDGLDVKFVGKAERRKFHDNSGRLTGIDDCLCDFFDGPGAWKAGHDNERVAGELSDILGNFHVGELEFGSPRRDDIEADHAPSAVDEITGNRATHDTEPDDSNSPVHEVSSRLSNSIDGQRTPRLNRYQAINNYRVVSNGQAAFVAFSKAGFAASLDLARPLLLVTGGDSEKIEWQVLVENRAQARPLGRTRTTVPTPP